MAERFSFSGCPYDESTGTYLSPEERAIRAAIDRGIHKYWDDAGQQAVAYNRWRDGGFEGDCAQISNGSINDYVFRSVMEMRHADAPTETQPRSTTE